MPESPLAGETFHEVYGRVMPKLLAMTAMHYPVDVYTVHIAPNLWQRLLREVGGDELTRHGRLFGLKAARDNTLNDDQIRIQHEVVA